MESLTLKWGTLKAWDWEEGSPYHELLKKYFALGSSASAMMQHDTPEQKELVLKMIDAVKAKKITLDWEGKDVSKKAAKKYVMEYGK